MARPEKSTHMKTIPAASQPDFGPVALPPPPPPTRTPAKQLARQFAQYVVVGGIAFGVDSGLLLLFKVGLGLHYQLAAAAGFIAGTLTNYGLCLRLAVFQDRVVSQRHYEIVLFAMVGIFGLLLNSQLMWLGVSWAGLPLTTVKLALVKLFSAAIVLLFNFGLRRQLLFNRHSPWALRLAAWSSTSTGASQDA